MVQDPIVLREHNWRIKVHTKVPFNRSLVPYRLTPPTDAFDDRKIDSWNNESSQFEPHFDTNGNFVFYLIKFRTYDIDGRTRSFRAKIIERCAGVTARVCFVDFTEVKRSVSPVKYTLYVVGIE